MAAVFDLIIQQETLLSGLFGTAHVEIEPVTADCCAIRTPIAEIHVAYDERKMHTVSSIRSLQVPDDLSDNIPVQGWLRFLNRDGPLRRSGPLSGGQVTAELYLVAEVVREALTNLRIARDAAYFLKGYDHGLLDAE